MGYTSLTNRETGAEELIDADHLDAALASGKYVPPQAVAVHRGGADTYATPFQATNESAFTKPIDPAVAAEAQGHATRARENSGILATGKALVGGAVHSLSFNQLNPFQDAQEFNEGASTAGNVLGVVAPMLFGDEAGAAGLFGKAVEAGDPLAVERATSSLSSPMLFRDGVGASSAEKGLAQANEILGEATGAAGARAVIPADLAELDAKGLNAAGKEEVENIKAARGPQQQQLVEDLAAHRTQLGDEKIWLATKDADAKAVGPAVGGVKEASAISFKADRQIRELLNNPKNLAENPKQMMGALQKQENALQILGRNEPGLRAVFAADETGARAAALDAVPQALERNRALQAKVRELTSLPSSERLTAIEDAKLALSMPKPAPSMAEQALSGTAFGAITGAAHAIPVLGQIPGVAHIIGAKGAKLLTDAVFGRLAKASTAQIGRTAGSVKAFVGAAAPAKSVPFLASKFLEGTSYGPPAPQEAAPSEMKHDHLAAAYKARTDEIKNQTMYDPSGVPVMRPEARQQLAARLAGIRAMAPTAADRIETNAVARLEYLASIMPRRPDVGGVPTGPDNWKPSDIEMRSFARSAHALEDPGAVEERAVHGTLTPEDAAAYHAVYPARAQHFTNQIIQQLPTMRRVLPYQRRLSLSIFTGQQVDASMHPMVIAVLQRSFAAEPNTNGGTQAPRAQPAFGSVKKSGGEPTPAQSRSQGAR